MDTTEFKNALEEPHEEVTQEYLSKNSQILIKTFFPTGSYVCIPKFRFGSEYVSDFLLAQLWSTTTRILLIELEPPTVKPFNRDGSHARRLNGAIQQVMSWSTWIRTNTPYFLESIEGRIMADRPLSHSAISKRLRYNTIAYKIIIGRRAQITDMDNMRRASLFVDTQERIEILPYDRLLDTAALI